ncbi:SYNERG-CTERM sorting domain-containing protein [Synergistaceae bacterium OttesenSCG-928-D05]|nr:SYNERG-CTERM sorting domain-containing protein [Synergistaceae bacterium OttesenSCG-928-D05]
MQTKQSMKVFCSKWRQVFLFTIFLSVLIVGAPLFAAEPIVPDTWDDVPDEYTLADGDTLDLSGLQAAAGGKTITIPASAKVKVIGSSEVAYQGLKFVLLQSADLTIQSLKIDNTDQGDTWHPVDVESTGASLTLEASNDLLGDSNTAAVRVPSAAGIEITSGTRGTLTAFGGFGAAIGGMHAEDAGTITITGNAAVTASASGLGAAIGGGGNITGVGGAGGIVTITDYATVALSATGGAAAIGGGHSTRSGEVGGEGEAESTGGAGGSVTVSGNALVTITAAEGSAAIGGGAGLLGGDGGTVVISDSAVVIASVEGDAAAIGGGWASEIPGGDGGTVTITGGTVYAYSESGYDIGPGKGTHGEVSDGAPADVIITGGSVNARAEHIKAEPVNAANTKLFLTSENYPYLAEQTLAFTVVPTAGESYQYSFRVQSDDKAYIWLPEGITPPEAEGSISLSADVVSAAYNTPGVQLTATVTGAASPLVWQRVSGDSVLATGDISSGSALLTDGIVPGGSYTYRAKGTLTYGDNAFSGDIYSNTAAAKIPDVTKEDISVTAHNLPVPIRAGDSPKITYTFANEEYPVTSVTIADDSGLAGSGFTAAISGDNEAVLQAASAVEGKNYTAQFDVIAGGMWLGPIGVSIDVLRAADSSDVRLIAENAPQPDIYIGTVADATYTAVKIASDLSELEASIGDITKSANWDDCGFIAEPVPESKDAFTLTGTAAAPGIYGLSVDLKLGDYKVATESLTYTIHAKEEDITVISDGDAEDILHGDIVDIGFAFVLEEFPDAEMKIIRAKGADGWEKSGLTIEPIIIIVETFTANDADNALANNRRALHIMGEANIPGEYEISVLLAVNGVPVEEITIPVAIAAKAEDITVKQTEGDTDPDNIREDDPVDITYGFGSDIPDVLIEVAGAAGREGWELSGLEVTVGPDGSVHIGGTAKRPGDYVIDVQLTVNGVPVEDVQILLSILNKETPPTPECSKSSGCNAAGAGLLAFALLPLIYTRKRDK